MEAAAKTAADLGQESPRMLQVGYQRLINAGAVPARQRLHPRRALSGHQAREADWIGTQIHQRAASQRRIKADVRLIGEIESERGVHGLYPSDRTGRHQFLQLRCVRLRPIGKAFDQQHAVASRGGEHRTRLAAGYRQRLFTQHVFAGLTRPDGPLGVQRIWQRIVDGIDRRIGEQLLVGTIRAVNAGFAGKAPCLAAVTARDRGDAYGFGPTDTRDERARNVGCAEYADPQSRVLRCVQWSGIRGNVPGIDPYTLAELGSGRPYHQRLACPGENRRDAVQEKRRKRDDRPARPGRDPDGIADLKLQLAAFVLRRLGQLDTDRYLARLGIVRAEINVPVIVAALCAAVDRVLNFLQAGHIEVINLTVEPAYHLEHAFIERSCLAVGLQP